MRLYCHDFINTLTRVLTEWNSEEEYTLAFLRSEFKSLYKSESFTENVYIKVLYQRQILKEHSNHHIT